MLRKIDPMVRLILVAILLATVLPVEGRAREVAQMVANVAVFTLFLLYGLRLSRREVLAGLGNHRLLVPLVIFVFGAMGLAGWALWQAGLPFMPPLLAIGFLYMGVLPSTVQSATVYSSLAGGNVASSVVAAALVNILGVFISAPLFSLLAGSHGTAFQGQELVKVLTMLLLPFVIGQALQGFTRGWVMEHKRLIATMDRSSIGIAVYVAFSGAVAQGIWGKVDTLVWTWVLVGCGLAMLVGYGGAWLAGGLLKLPRGDRIAMLFAGGQKSIAMGAPLATVIFPPASAGMVILPLIVYHLLQMVVAAPIASRLQAGADAGTRPSTTSG
jgi:solute carrier family 10 (sodium/bile acid cotransporter), member 7